MKYAPFFFTVIKGLDGNNWVLINNFVGTHMKRDTSTCPPEPMATEAFLAAMDECKDDHRAVLTQKARKAMAW